MSGRCPGGEGGGKSNYKNNLLRKVAADILILDGQFKIIINKAEKD